MTFNTFTLAKIAAVVVAFPYVLKQVRKPDRWLGRIFLWIMNRSHSSLTDWGLGHVAIEKDAAILDVGCGGGRTIEKMAAAAPDGRFFGVDYAQGSVAASRARNAPLGRTGRVDIRLASVSDLPFSDNQFDLVTAVETHYYWPNLSEDVRGILRVLKPGGTLALIAENYKGGTLDVVQGPVMKLLGSNRLTPDGHRELLASAGFSDVQVFIERAHGWICATGRKPS